MGSKPSVDAICRSSFLLVLSLAPRGCLHWHGLNLREIVSVRVKTLSNTNLVVSSHVKKLKTSLSVDVHCSKMGLLIIEDLRFDLTAFNVYKYCSRQDLTLEQTDAH